MSLNLPYPLGTQIRRLSHWWLSLLIIFTYVSRAKTATGTTAVFSAYDSLITPAPTYVPGGVTIGGFCECKWIIQASQKFDIDSLKAVSRARC